MQITPYQRRHRRDLVRLIEDQYRVHIHLDWTTVDDWIDDSATLIQLAWDQGTLIGAFAAAPPIEGVAWLRLAIVHDDADPGPVFAALWAPFVTMLRAAHSREIAILMLRPWVREYLLPLGFDPREEVVTLARNGGAIPEPLRSDVTILHGDARDLDRVVQVDHSAFPPIYQMPPDSIRHAIRGANSFTLALDGNRVLGYQIAMRYADGGHLARLATIPAAQGSGVGGALLGEMLTSFQRRGFSYVTVNTQETNQKSLSLYRRYGFQLTGLDFPVYVATL